MSSPQPTPEELHDLAALLGALVAQLSDVAAGIRSLAADVAADWPDARGREWVEQAGMLHRDLHREAEDGGALARRVERLAEDLGARPAEPGPRLGGTEAARVSPGWGVRLATLPDGPAPR